MAETIFMTQAFYFSIYPHFRAATTLYNHSYIYILLIFRQQNYNKNPTYANICRIFAVFLLYFYVILQIDNKLKNLLCEVQGMFDGGSHVVVFILSEATTEEDVLFGVREGFVLGVEHGVSLIVNGIVGFHARLPLGGILTADYGFGIVIDRLAERFEMLVLDDASIGNIVRGVVDHSVALVVRSVERLGFKTHCTILEFAETVIVELIYWSGVDNCVGKGS